MIIVEDVRCRYLDSFDDVFLVVLILELEGEETVGRKELNIPLSSEREFLRGIFSFVSEVLSSNILFSDNAKKTDEGYLLFNLIDEILIASLAASPHASDLNLAIHDCWSKLQRDTWSREPMPSEKP